MSYLRTETDHGDGYVTTHIVEWPRMTAGELRQHWINRARAAHWDHEVIDGVLVATLPSYGWVERKSFHDTDPGGHPVQGQLPEEAS